MLAGAEIVPFSERVCRLANTRNYRAALAALSQQEPEIQETLSTLGESDKETADQLIDSIFRDRPDLPPRRPTRFSSGQWPVLYASLDWATAKDECAHYIRIGEGTIRLHKISCMLSSTTCFDLRPLVDTHSFLTEKSEAIAYPQCQALAAEALEAKAGALITYSARRDGGVNTPAFDRDVISDAAIEGQVLFHMSGGGIRVVEDIAGQPGPN